MTGPIFPGPRRWRGPDYRIRITPGKPKPVARVAGSRYRPLIRSGLVGSVVAVLIVSATSPPGLALALSVALFAVCAAFAIVDGVRQP
jgi:hypothetical protein